MAEEKRAAAKPAVQAKAPEPVLASAAASSDPAVHQVLAELQTAQANSNGEEAERLRGRLTELGYE